MAPMIVSVWLHRVLVPPYWTSVRTVAFSFTPFNDSMSGTISYEWGLASQPGIDDVIPFRPFDGILKVGSSTRHAHMFVCASYFCCFEQQHMFRTSMALTKWVLA